METITYNGTEKSLADWGIALDSVQRTASNLAEDVLGFSIPLSVAATASEVFPPGAKIIFRINRTKAISGGTFSGGTVHFIGYRVNGSRVGQPGFDGLNYVFQNAWSYFLENTTYQSVCVSYRDGATSVVDFSPRVMLNLSPAGVVLTTGQQITGVIEFAAIQAKAMTGQDEFQPDAGGYFDWPFYVDEVVCLSCAEVIRKQLRMAYFAAWFDYTTTKAGQPCPTFRCVPRSSLVPVTIPLADGLRHEGFNLTERDDLVPSAISLIYRRLCTVNSQEKIAHYHDIACAAGATTSGGVTAPALYSAAVGVGVVPQIYDFQGVDVAVTRYSIVTDVIAASTVDWWKDHLPALKSPVVSEIAVSEVTFDPPLGDCIYELTEGTITDEIDGITTQSVTVTARINYSVANVPAGEVVESNTATRGREFTVKLTAINVPSGDYTLTKVSGTNEPLPFGLAKYIYDELKVAHWEGDVSIVEQTNGIPGVSGAITLGNSLNFTGGLTDWAAIKAQLQQITWSYAEGRTTLRFGPPKHIGAGDRIEFMRTARSRQVRTNLQNYLTGDAPGQVVEAPKNTPAGASDRESGQRNKMVIGTDSGTGKIILDESTTGGDELTTRIVRDCLNNLPGWRYVLCGPFHAGTPPAS